MIDVLAVLVTGLPVIAVTSIIGPRVGIATPLVLVAIGVAARHLPMFASIHIDPSGLSPACSRPCSAPQGFPVRP